MNSTSERKTEIIFPIHNFVRASSLALILFIVFLFIEPPVTIFGWLFGVALSLLLLYLCVQSIIIFRKQK